MIDDRIIFLEWPCTEHSAGYHEGSTGAACRRLAHHLGTLPHECHVLLCLATSLNLARLREMSAGSPFGTPLSSPFSALPVEFPTLSGYKRSWAS